MSNCFIFTTGTTGGNPPGQINLQGFSQEESLQTQDQWSCLVNYNDNVATIQAKIKLCVTESYLLNRAIIIGGSDKVTFVGGFS